MPTSFRLPWRILAASTGLAMLAATSVYVLLDDERSDRAAWRSSGTVELTPADDVPSIDEASYTTFDGERVRLATLRGTPTVVNFFSSTCVPCITEMPAFEVVYQDLRDGVPVRFLGLAVADRTDDVLALIEETGVTYPTAEDTDVSVITALGGTVLPTTVILSATGEIVAAHAGELQAAELRALLDEELGLTS